MKLLVTGAIQWTKEQLDYLVELGHEVIYVQDERIPLEEQNIDVKKIEGVICNGLFLYNNIEEFINLKYIQLTSAGLDRVPLEYIKQNNIKLFNARGVYSIPMAEYAILGVLEIYKKSNVFFQNQKNHLWEKQRDLWELVNKNVAIVGTGDVGYQVAKRFKAFDTNIIGFDLFPREIEYFDKVHSLDELSNEINNIDILILTAPHSKYTHYIVNEELLKNAKNTLLIVNIARGGLIDQECLIQALEQNKVMGAVLDVFENEPLSSTNELWDRDNVIITPHNSFVGEYNFRRMHQVIIKNLKEI